MLRRLAAAAAFALVSAQAHAQTHEECFAAADKAQLERDAGKYSAARESLTICARTTCPALVQRDCGDWLEKLTTTWPTIVLHADLDGADIAIVNVTVDGVVVATRLDGRPLSVDPGEHTVRFEIAGKSAIEEKIVVSVGEKNRAVDAHFPGEPKPSDALPIILEENRRPSSSAPFVAAGVFTGLAVAAFATDLVFFGMALSTFNQMKMPPSSGGCADNKSCDPDTVDRVHSQFVASDVALSIGIGAAALAVTFFVIGAIQRSHHGAAIVPAKRGAGFALTF